MFVANRRARARAGAGRALRRRDDHASTSCPSELERRRHRRRLDLVAAPARRGRGARAGHARRAAGRPLLLIDLAVPRDVDPACAELPASRSTTSTTCSAVVARHQLVRRAEARKAEGIVEEEIQRFAGWLGSLEVTADDRGAARARRRDRRPACWPRTRAAGRSLSERDRARVEAIARAVVKRLLHEPTLRLKQRRRRAPRAACSCCASCSGSRSRGDARTRADAGRSPPAAPRRLMRIGTRGSALALAQASWVAALLGGARGRRARARRATTAARAGDKARWVDEIEEALLAGEVDLAVHSAKDVPGELRRGHARSSARPTARRIRGDGSIGALRRARASGRRRCAAARSCCAGAIRTSRSSSCAATSTRGCASSPTARSTRSCSPPPGCGGSAAPRRRRGARPAAVRAGARPGRARARGARGDDDAAARRRSTTPARTPRWPPSAPPCACSSADCHTPVGVARRRRRLACAGFVGRPDGSAWVRDEVDGLRRRGAGAARDAAPPAARRASLAA